MRVIHHRSTRTTKIRLTRVNIHRLSQVMHHRLHQARPHRQRRGDNKDKDQARRLQIRAKAGITNNHHNKRLTNIKLTRRTNHRNNSRKQQLVEKDTIDKADVGVLTLGRERIAPSIMGSTKTKQLGPSSHLLVLQV